MNAQEEEQEQWGSIDVPEDVVSLFVHKQDGQLTHEIVQKIFRLVFPLYQSRRVHMVIFSVRSQKLKINWHSFCDYCNKLMRSPHGYSKQ